MPTLVLWRSLYRLRKSSLTPLSFSPSSVRRKMNQLGDLLYYLFFIAQIVNISRRQLYWKWENKTVNWISNGLALNFIAKKLFLFLSLLFLYWCRFLMFLYSSVLIHITLNRSVNGPWVHERKTLAVNLQKPFALSNLHENFCAFTILFTWIILFLWFRLTLIACPIMN